MIVVAIIGLLAAISAPLYDRYQAKVRQSEAKLALAAIFSSEKSFYVEYSAYISSMDALHYVPEGGRRFYTVGWQAAMTGTVTGYSGSYLNPSYDSANTPSIFGCAPAAAKLKLPNPTPTDSQSFLSGAAGEVRVGRGCDVWTIDQDKSLQNSESKI